MKKKDLIKKGRLLKKNSFIKAPPPIKINTLINFRLYHSLSLKDLTRKSK